MCKRPSHCFRADNLICKCVYGLLYCTICILTPDTAGEQCLSTQLPMTTHLLESTRGPGSGQHQSLFF